MYLKKYPFYTSTLIGIGILISCLNACTFQKERASTTGWNYNRSTNGAYSYTTSTRGAAYYNFYFDGSTYISTNSDPLKKKEEHDKKRSADSFYFEDDSILQQSENTLVSIAMRDVSEVASAYEKYNPFTENNWIHASGEFVKSTFSIDVDNAAYTNFRRFVNEGQLPPKDAIRLEEWLNFFNYDLNAPDVSDPHPLKIETEVGPCPWNEEDDLVMIKMQGKLPVEEELPPSNLVFLVDVSGSMSSENKLPLVQTSMNKLADKLRPQDKLSIVTYAGNSSILLNPTSGNEKIQIKDAIKQLSSNGGTNGSEGIITAYQLAEESFIAGGNNRVIIATDGDWNIGITNNQELKKMIEEKRETGIFLSVLGFGMYNLNDQMMEMMADNGNGNYCYIDNEKEADRIFNTEFSGSMYTIAKDVKLQVLFDSTVVEKYRLIGYENRVLENWQFEADSIDAGDLGMGQNVIAFYQVHRKQNQTGSLGKIDFRYKALDSEISTLLSHQVETRKNELSTDFNFASCVVEFAMCLRESEFRGDATFGRAILRGKQNLGDPAEVLSYEKRIEFVGLMEKVGIWYEDYVTEEAPLNTVKDFPQFKLFPNPASEFTSIEIPADVSAAWSVQIFNMSGSLVHVQHFQETTVGRIELSDLIPGMYIVKIYNGGINFGYLKLVKS